LAGKTPLVTPLCDDVMKRREIISTKPRWKRVSVCIFLSFGLFMLLCVPPALHNIYFIRLRHDIAYMCRRCHYKHQRAKPNKTNYRIPRFFHDAYRGVKSLLSPITSMLCFLCVLQQLQLSLYLSSSSCCC